MAEDNEVKPCSCCNEILPFSNFNKNRNGKFGLDSYCKKCRKEKYKLTAKDRISRQKKYYSKNKEKICAYGKKWRENNPEITKEYARVWGKKNPEKLSNFKKRWAKNNPEKVKNIADKTRRKNIRKHRERLRNWCKKNPEKTASYGRKRRALKIKALDANHNPLFENVLEQMRVRLQGCLKIPFNIDHIIPLSRGGKHHHLNLQVIPQTWNYRKGSKLNFNICYND